MITASELKKKYIEFFRQHDHAPIKSASLVPENDPTCLFTTAGMHPLVPYLMGQKHPAGNRLVNVQKCVRTGDIDSVGDETHLTYFEMLGNWSLGDYFKKEAISFSYEFLTSEKFLGLPPARMAVSVFAGDNDAAFDQFAYDCWRSLGIPEARLARLGKEDNWWGPAGQTGPCGPDTEMFYWTGGGSPPENFDPDDSRWVEIWNDVFMEYNKTPDGLYVPLSQKNVDTGMGVERVTAILQGKSSVYDTELFTPLFERLQSFISAHNPRQSRGGRIVVEHLRAAVFIITTGIVPANVDQGYVLRRLIRRAIREGRQLGIDGHFTRSLAEAVITQYTPDHPDLESRAVEIYDTLETEEAQFKKTLDKGLYELNKLLQSNNAIASQKTISGIQAFDLYQTYGFPLELVREIARDKGYAVAEAEFYEEFKKHQALSREGAEKKFKGGLADHSDATTRLHTATHLLHKALRMVLGDHVAQKGSNITADRLRFDFSHPDKMDEQQLKQVETIVNEQIRRGLPVSRSETSVSEAKKQGAIGLFEEKYGEVVSVYTIGDFSMEICGGPHVQNSAELGQFKILKEESSSRGVRRIKAVLN